MNKVCVVVATAFTARAFLMDQIRALSALYHLSIATGDNEPELFHGMPVTAFQVPIVRNISPLADVRALVSLYRLCRRQRFDAVHSVTPKAGLLAMLASRMAGVPLRVHTFTGQVWATQTGFTRLLLKSLDRLLAACATHVLADSASQLAFLREQHVLRPGQGEVLASGSISGVDAARFRPDPATRALVRVELDIPDAATVFVFVGRLKRDKGVVDLAQAFARVAAETNAYLVLVGPDEEALTGTVRSAAGANLRLVGMTGAPERYMAAGDVFCLPSYREGFGAVIIEAAAAGLPAIGSRIYGITDAIGDGVTGILVAAADVEGLADAMRLLALDEPKRRALAHAARERALNHFSRDVVTAAVVAFYERILQRPQASRQVSRAGRFDAEQGRR
jgi:glycosyltransferase involved in cell wall biosynthesis